MRRLTKNKDNQSFNNSMDNQVVIKDNCKGGIVQFKLSNINHNCLFYLNNKNRFFIQDYISNTEIKHFAVEGNNFKLSNDETVLITWTS